jgi:predicted metal-binding membrane protein
MTVRVAAVTTPRIREIHGHDSGVVTPHPSPSSRIWLTIAGAWLVIVIAQASGNAAALHHHQLIEGRTPVTIAIAIFLIAWLVMIVAMMWPASLPAVNAFRRTSPNLLRPRLAVATFLGTSAIVWAGFGLAAFVGDVVVHHIVDTSPWLGARSWLIEAGVLATAGAYQFMPLKRRYLAACRRPGDRVTSSVPSGSSAIGLGLRHGLDCLGSSWALMLVMFASGFASASLMAALTLLMAYEATGRHGERAATAAGVVLLLAALATLSGPLPGVA